jgi:hypothetical protein
VRLRRLTWLIRKLRGTAQAHDRDRFGAAK